MKINFLTDNLVNFLPSLSKITPSHSQIPVLSSILVKAEKDTITLSATDLEFGTVFTIPGKVEKEGGVLVPGKQFIEVLASLSREKVLLEQERDDLVMETTTGTYRFTSLPKDEFPKLYEEKGERVAEFTPGEFQDIFGKLTFAVSQDESRPHLTGVYAVRKEESTDFVATDGFRMSLKRMRVKKTLERLKTGLIIPQRLVMEAISVKSAQNVSLFVYDKGNQAIFETGNAVLVGRLIEGQYPDYEKVIPKTLATSIKLEKEELSRILKTVSVFARENANVISFNISNGIINLNVASSSIGGAEVKMEGVQTGEDNNISFNIRFVADFLRVVGGKYITIRVNSSGEPSLFTSDDDPDFMHVIMPVRVEV